MTDTRWTEADARRYLQQTGRGLAVGSMALDTLRPTRPTAALVIPPEQTSPTHQYASSPYRSRVEHRYALRLETGQKLGDIQAWWHEPLKLRLGEKCYYTPDFLVIEAVRPHQLMLVETKGAYARDDAIVKLKTAAKLYPCFAFVWAQWKQGAWHERIVKPH